MKKQGGFTLIELVVVIVILGILAVTAAPRFLNLQDDAREASLEGLRGAIAGAMGISYGRSAVKGLEATAYVAGETKTVVGGIVHHYGYPTAVSDKTANLGGILQALDLSDDFSVLASDKSNDATDQSNEWIDIGFTGYTEKCVRYIAAKDATTPAKVELIEGEAGKCGLTAP
ncbi:prepilin-type N-terminal cleavage/methylation domain-containing protein [Vibrio japonicus]|uniref:Type II secretion system GspH family protein n=1 Tax=Vibrio japonicus TaxID=1824638 RepID=A0ABY5LHI1_9VIBR|nr:type II secretion system protein [Vibrio japonicus]UUM30911.1 type II secretion system GspH family protein [Vibrio japonicus]